MKHEIMILGWHPAALNQYIGKKWYVGHKLKKLDKYMIRAHTLNLPKAKTKRRVDLHIMLGKGQKKRDPDAYWKSLLDALVHAKMLTDDNHAGVELGAVSYSRGKMATLIVLTDLPPE